MEGSYNEVDGFAIVGCIGSLLNDLTHFEHIMGIAAAEAASTNKDLGWAKIREDDCW
jgi:hypothetical protein